MEQEARSCKHTLASFLTNTGRHDISGNIIHLLATVMCLARANIPYLLATAMTPAK